MELNLRGVADQSADHPRRNAGIQPWNLSQSYADVMRHENEEQARYPIHDYPHTAAAEEVVDPHRRQHSGRPEATKQLSELCADLERGRGSQGSRYLAVAATRFYVIADACIVELDMDDDARRVFISRTCEAEGKFCGQTDPAAIPLFGRLIPLMGRQNAPIRQRRGFRGGPK